MTALLPRAALVEDAPGTRSTATAARSSTGPLWLGTSWKMTKTLAEARAYAHALARVPIPVGVTIFLLPPLTALHAVLGERDGSGLGSDPAFLVGVQNAHWAPDGPVTGEVSMHLVRDAGAEIVEIGHSDRRTHGESDQVVAAKVTAALDQRLTPLICVGEPWSVRAAGRAASYVADQLRTALSGVAPADLARVLVAYEPVWAIGDSGRAAAPGHIVGVLDRIRSVVTELAPDARLGGLLYGGSVTTDNAAALLALDDLDGLFVGRAAWTVDGFTALLDICGEVAATRAARSPGSARPTTATSAQNPTHEQRSR